MTELAIIVFVALMTFLIISKISNRIPSTGRCIDARGEEIEAVIVNENRTAEKAATMKLEDSEGNKYRVKLRAGEAKMWIEGDAVKIIFSEDKKNYRVLFNDYFRSNEERMRKHTVEKISKINTKLLPAHFTGYKKEDSEALLNSGADSLTLFVFLTYMRRITGYLILSIVMTAFLLGWYNIFTPNFVGVILPIILVAVSYFVLYSTVMSCKKILDKFAK